MEGMRGLTGVKMIFGDKAGDEMDNAELAPTVTQSVVATVQGESQSDVPSQVSDGLQADKTKASPAAGKEKKGRVNPWVVPPSEMPNIPSNVFVSSMSHTAPRRTDRRREKAYRQTDAEEEEGAATNGGEEESSPSNGLLTQDDSTQPRQMAPAPDAEQSGTDASLAWAKLSVAFDVLDSLNPPDLSLCPIGTIVAWKEVELDMITYTPEVRLQLAKVVSADSKKLDLEKMRRPVEPVDLGDDEEGYENGGEDQVMEEPEAEEFVRFTLRPADLTQGRYKRVPESMCP